MDKEYRYKLAKKGKNICPQCGKRTFVSYIDTKTRIPLPEKYGKCDRLDKCNYHLNPYKDGYGWILTDEWKEQRRQETLNRNYRIPPKLKVSHINTQTVQRSLTKYQGNTLIQYLCKVCGTERVIQAVKRYKIGTTKQGGTIFWQIDDKNNVHAGKIITYNADGHRNHDIPPNWVHKALKLDSYNLEQCLFGLHLLPDNTTAAIGIVEAEKTAFIASIYLPSFLWLACGGLQNISGQIQRAASILKGRKIVLFPDLKAADKWKAKAQELKNTYSLDISVSEYLEKQATESEKEKGLDIADYLLGVKPPQAEPSQIEPVQPIKKTKAVNNTKDKETSAKDLKQHKSRILAQQTETDFTEDWSTEISELETFFKNTTLPQTLRLNDCTFIIDVLLFIDNHFQTVKANNGNITFIPYLERLQVARDYIK
ncbi:MAG: DUF6371 domain-containing protein [Bacteroidales bacterium]|jgi:hypothetical protein|nr:DUF6371 domain-containing protein [Bacteroidales bacterium]